MKWLTICRILIDGDRNRSFPSDLQYAIGRDNNIKINVSVASTASSFRMKILTQRGGLPTVSPGRNTSDVFRDEKSCPAESRKIAHIG